MKIGLISDVHGNQPALEAVLRDMPDVEQIYHLGDVVGYNPFPHQVIATFQREEITTIQGNHDRKISTDVESMGTATDPKNRNSIKIHPGEIARTAGIWTYNKLDTEECEYLANLPAERTVQNGALKLVHGMPGDQDGRLYPEDYDLALFDDESVLAHGHTHIQHFERFDERLLINPGSVGQPRDGDPRAAYAILDLEATTVDLCRVEYPVEEVANKIRQTSLPDLLCLWLEKGEIVAEA